MASATTAMVCMYVHVYMYVYIYIVHAESGGRLESLLCETLTGSSFFFGKMTALGVLCFFALFVCLTLLASSFLPSHLSLKHVCKLVNWCTLAVCTIKLLCVHVRACVSVWFCVCLHVHNMRL